MLSFSAPLCRCFVINYSGFQPWYRNAKYLPYPFSSPLGQQKSLINTACISSTCITHISWVFAAWKNAAWLKTTVIMGQQEIMSLLAEKSWHLDSIFFFQRKLNDTMEWIIPDTFLNHNPQHKCKEASRIKKENWFLKRGSIWTVSLIPGPAIWSLKNFSVPSICSLSPVIYFFIPCIFFFNVVFWVTSVAVKSHTWFHLLFLRTENN